MTALVAAAGAWKLRGGGRHPSALAVLVALAGALVLVFGYRTWLVRALPNSDVLASGRCLLFVVFFLSLAAGHGARVLQVWGRRRPGRQPVLTLLILAVVADLGPTTFQHAYKAPGDRDSAGIPLSFYDALRRSAEPYQARGQLPGYRAIWSRGPLHRYLSTGLTYFHARTPTPDGPHPGELRAVFDFVRPFQHLLHASLPPVGGRGNSSVHLEYPVYAGLSLLNVRYLLVHQADRSSFWLEQEHASPIAVAPSLSPPPAAGAWLEGLPAAVVERLVRDGDPRDVARVSRLLAELRGMGVDPPGRTCRTFFIDGLETPVDLGTRPHLTLAEHAVRNQHVALRVEVDARCFARLAYAAYPHVEVRVDGRTVDPLTTSASFVVVELDAGAHSITLEPRLSPLHRVLLLASSGLVLAVAALYLRSLRA